MSVYSVVITSGIVVVLANLMSDQATLAFITITSLILASTTATLTLLFLPQLAHILAGERADPVVQSLGLKIECNTRRFVTDDRRELQYRVEVQNRVYRREMAQLELELVKMEKQLGQEPMDPSHVSSSASIPQRNPSISGGLPMLLLSVLPPVIPRASWPSADPSDMGASLISSRVKICGSPRFPHRIMPANSLDTIGPGQLSAVMTPNRSHSMEDPWKPRMQTIPRGSSCDPNFVVWAIQGVSELSRTSHGKRPSASDPHSFTIQADSDLSPDDSRLGNDLQKLLREYNIGKELSCYTAHPPSSSSLDSPVRQQEVKVKDVHRQQQQEVSMLTSYVQESEHRRSQSPVVVILNEQSKDIIEPVEIAQNAAIENDGDQTSAISTIDDEHLVQGCVD